MSSRSITRVIALRHAETEWNVQRRIQGHGNSALTEQGMMQIQALARRLADEPIQCIYSSDLLRSRLTAEAVALPHQLPIHIDLGIRERHFGIFEGMTHAEIRRRYPYSWLMHRSGDPDYVLPEGESPRAFFMRVRQAFQRLAEAHRGETIVVVTHGGTLMMLNRAIRQVSPRGSVELTHNTSVNILACSGSEWDILTWNDTRHLV